MRNWILFFILFATGYGLSLERHKLGIVIFNQEDESIQVHSRKRRDYTDFEDSVRKGQTIFQYSSYHANTVLVILLGGDSVPIKFVFR